MLAVPSMSKTNVPRLTINSGNMTVVLSSNKEPAATTTSSCLFVVGRFVWHQRQLLYFWLLIVLVPFVILNSFYLYSFYTTEASAAEAIITFNSSSAVLPPATAALPPPRAALPRPSAALPPPPAARPPPPAARPPPAEAAKTKACELLRGTWVRDKRPALYTNHTCKYIQPFQNCMKNGKPDTGYLNWRWKPSQCELPRFDPALFLELMRGKKLLFFGDSLARNHMQSLLCSLSQVEEPVQLFTRVDRDVKWGFTSHNFTLTILWTPFLVKHVQVQSEPTMLFNLHLDTPHPAWYNSLAEYDIAIFSASQWFFRASVYLANNTVIGCNEYSGKNYRKIKFVQALGTALATTLRSISSTGFKGTAIFRTVTPEHFEHGTWSTGGTCLRQKPFRNQSMDMGWMPNTFKEAQLREFDRFAAAPDVGFRLRLWNVTRAMFMRPDGHPGPYRLFQPFADGKTKHVQNDCLHWCLPGPIDMWNQLLLDVVKQEHGRI